MKFHTNSYLFFSRFIGGNSFSPRVFIAPIRIFIQKHHAWTSTRSCCHGNTFERSHEKPARGSRRPPFRPFRPQGIQLPRWRDHPIADTLRQARKRSFAKVGCPVTDLTATSRWSIVGWKRTDEIEVINLNFFFI